MAQEKEFPNYFLMMIFLIYERGLTFNLKSVKKISHFTFQQKDMTEHKNYRLNGIIITRNICLSRAMFLSVYKRNLWAKLS